MPTMMEDPKLECLPAAQRRLWDRLDEVPSGFVLYGGTALALWLGHRQSVDFDFFSGEPFNNDDLRSGIPFLKGAKPEVDTAGRLAARLPGSGVKFDFVGPEMTGGMRSVHEPAKADNGICVASIADLFGCKCMAAQHRLKRRDYIDIFAIMDSTGYTLADGLAFGKAIYGSRFKPGWALLLLEEADGLDGPVPAHMHERIAEAARGAKAAMAEDPDWPPAAPARDGIAPDGMGRGR